MDKVITKVNQIKDSFLSYLNENNKKVLQYAVGISIIGIGGTILYHRVIFPRYYPVLFEDQKLKNTINNIQKSQKSIIALNVLRRIKLVENGIAFNFCVLKDLDKKPLGSSGGQTSNPFLPPFEDGLYVQELSKTHTLLFNKFAVVRNHMLVVTTKFELQDSLLNASDFSAAHKVLFSLKGFYFFNSGPNAGASQQHKHIQVMPFEARQDTPIINLLYKRVKKLQGQAEYIVYPPFEFSHIIKALQPKHDKQSIEEYGEYLEKSYIDCMNFLNNITIQDGVSQLKNAYNMIVMDNFMFIVLRKQERTVSPPAIAINAMGFTGSFLLKTHQEIKSDQNILPFTLLKEVSLPKEETANVKQSNIEGFLDIKRITKEN